MHKYQNQCSALLRVSNGKRKTGWNSMSYKYVLDSSAWVEYLGASARAVKIKELVEQESIATSILAVAELADKFEREGRAFDKTLQFMQTRAAIVQLSIPLALAAAKIKKEQ